MSFPGQTVTPFGSGYDRLPITPGAEGHFIERAAMRQIFAHIEQECERQEEIWIQRDRDFANAMGIAYTASQIERPRSSNYYVGSRPSLIASSLDFWPSITTFAGVRKAANEQFDQLDVIDCDLFVEVLSKFGPVPQEQLHLQPGIDAEGEVNKQVQRLAGAAHMCIKLDPTLGAIVEPIQRPPITTPTKPFALPGNMPERSGPYWLYQGIQMRYVVQANSF